MVYQTLIHSTPKEVSLAWVLKEIEECLLACQQLVQLVILAIEQTSKAILCEILIILFNPFPGVGRRVHSKEG